MFHKTAEPPKSIQGGYLSPRQVKFLSATRKFGMTANIVGTWCSLDEKSHPNVHMRWNGYRYVYDGNYSMFSYNDSFTREHAETATFLLARHQVAPQDAMNAIKDLSAKEAVLLKDFFYEGKLTPNPLQAREFILAHRDEYAFSKKTFHDCLHLLVNQKKLNLAQAMEEVRGLGASELVVLLDLYDDGLRGEDIRSFNHAQHPDFFKTYAACKDSERYTTCFEIILPVVADRQAVSYFKKLFRHEVAQNSSKGAFAYAAAQLAYIFDHRLRVTPEYSYALRVLRHTLDERVTVQQADPLFHTSEARKTYRYLKYIFELSSAKALDEMQGLDEQQLKILRHFYYAHVRRSHLIDFPGTYKQMQILTATFDVAPLNAIKLLKCMNKHSREMLPEMIASGLTLPQLQHMRFEYSVDAARKDLVATLIQLKGYEPKQAWDAVGNKSDAELAALINEETPRFTSVKLG